MSFKKNKLRTYVFTAKRQRGKGACKVRKGIELLYFKKK